MQPEQPPIRHSRPQDDDLRMLSGIVFISRNGWRWGDAPKEYGPVKTLCKRWKRWSDDRDFARIVVGLAAGGRSEHDRDRCDLSGCTAHGLQTACKNGGRGRRIGRGKGGLNTNLHALSDSEGRPMRFSHVGQASQRPHHRRRCRVICRRPNGCWWTGDMTLTGCEKRWKTRLHPWSEVLQPGRETRHALLQTG